MGRRRLFRRDLGEHPPEIQEFLESWHHYPRRGAGEFRRISIGAPSSAEVRENARWFGRLLLVVAVLLPVAYWKLAGDRLTTFGYVSLFFFSAGFAAFGVVLLRSSGGKRQPELRRESNKRRASS
jgi:hypothetical protein